MLFSQNSHHIIPNPVEIFDEAHNDAIYKQQLLVAIRERLEKGTKVYLCLEDRSISRDNLTDEKGFIDPKKIDNHLDTIKQELASSHGSKGRNNCLLVSYYLWLSIAPYIKSGQLKLCLSQQVLYKTIDDFMQKQSDYYKPNSAEQHDAVSYELYKISICEIDKLVQDPNYNSNIINPSIQSRLKNLIFEKTQLTQAINIKPNNNIYIAKLNEITKEVDNLLKLYRDPMTYIPLSSDLLRSISMAESIAYAYGLTVEENKKGNKIDVIASMGLGHTLQVAYALNQLNVPNNITLNTDFSEDSKEIIASINKKPDSYENLLNNQSLLTSEQQQHLQNSYFSFKTKNFT